MPVSTHLNLTFHGIGEAPLGIDDAEREVWVPRPSFLEILDFVHDRQGVAITFDDGNISDVTVALPALIERGMTAKFFIATGRLGAPGYADASHLGLLHEAGMEIGSHGMEHRSWRGLSNSESRTEFHEARRRLESEVRSPVTAAACPFGAYDRQVLRGLRSAGFTQVFSSDGGFASGQAWLQPRNTLTRAANANTVERMLQGRGPMRSRTRRVKVLAKSWR